MQLIVMKYSEDSRWASPKLNVSDHILYIFDLFVNKESAREFLAIVYNDAFRIESIQSRVAG
jgi:hypothetical protein